jgi:hypothetical protein
LENRIRILQAPNAVVYGQTFNVVFETEAQSNEVMRVVFMRCGSVTHSFDGDQRFVGVPFKQSETNLTINAPPDGTVAPPGYYMLWVVGAGNVPCKQSVFIRLSI